MPAVDGARGLGETGDMSPHRRGSGHAARAVAARVTVSVLLVLVLAVLAFAIVLQPVLLLAVLAGAAVGVLVRVGIKRRRAGRARRTRGAEGSGDDFDHFEAPRGGAPRVLGRVAVGVAAILIVVFVSQNSLYDSVDVPGLDPGRPLEETVRRAPYRADLTFQDRGDNKADWHGVEWFTLKPAEAKALVVERAGPLMRRLRAAVPAGWSVRRETTGKATVYRIRRDYPSNPFDVPSWRPLTVTTSLPAPELRSRGIRYPLFAAEKSAITLHAPDRRILATAPSSEASLEAGARVRRVVELDVIGSQKAGSGVEVEVESDLATHLVQEWLGHGTWRLVTGIFTALGLTLTAATGTLKKGLKWLLRKTTADDTEPTRNVLRGKASKTAALTSYLEGKGLTADEVRSEVNRVVHEARQIANEIIANSSDPSARAAYDAERRRLTNEGKLHPLDAVYAALKKAGATDDELDVLDTSLDRKIITAQEPASQPAGDA